MLRSIPRKTKTRPALKYFTRSLYEQLQPGSGVPPEVALANWSTAVTAYRTVAATIKSQLPRAMQRLDESSLHDATIQRAETTPDGVVVIEADQNPWYTTLTFRGVLIAEGINDIIGDRWLHEEAHLHAKAAFDFRVLLEKSQFRIIADDVTLEVKTIVPPLSDDVYARRIHLEECLTPLVGQTMTVEFPEVDPLTGENCERFVLEDASLILETGDLYAKREKPLDRAIYGCLADLGVAIEVENIVRLECPEGRIIIPSDQVPPPISARVQSRPRFTTA
jgi:hypothetical protein